MNKTSFVAIVHSMCVASSLTFAALSAGLAQAPAGGVTVSGRVQDAQTRAALPFLTVQLKSEKDSAFVAGRLTDNAGGFTFTGLAKGVYLLDARIMGYAPLVQR